MNDEWFAENLILTRVVWVFHAQRFNCDYS